MTGNQDDVRTVTSGFVARADTSEYKVRTLDILIYQDGGTGMLEKRVHVDGMPRSLGVEETEGGKIAVIFANLPAGINEKYLERFDSLTEMDLMFKDEDPTFPVMTGYAGYMAGDVSRVELRPFICKVVISSVSNAMDGYVLAESPYVRLSDLNPSVHPLQESGFIPSEVIEDGVRTDLPYDIGFYTQEPGTTLYCYPDSSDPDMLGSRHTALTFGCTINGTKRSCTCPLPEMGRNSTVRASVMIDVGGNVSITYF